MNNFSNINKRNNNLLCKIPKCIDCGTILTIKNTYKNSLKNKNYRCLNCRRIYTKLFYRKYKLNTTTGNLTLKAKYPEHPIDNKCMLCGRFPTRSKGLSFHHWHISEDKIAYGIWLCCVCHMFAERVDNNFIPKYKTLKQKYLIVGKKP